MHLNHQRGEGYNRRKAADYPYSDTSYNQEWQRWGNAVRRKQDKVTVREGRREYNESKALDPDVPVLVLHREP